MQIDQGIVTLAKRHGRKKLAASSLPGESFSQVDKVVHLLSNTTSSAAQRGARMLLEKMSKKEWKVIRGAHVSVDETLHVLIDVAGTRFHLRLDGNACVFDITYIIYVSGKNGERRRITVRLSGHDPWVRAGA